MSASNTNLFPVGNPGDQREGTSVVQVSPISASNPGPKNPIAASQAPSSELPPSTDRGDIQNFWFPFARAHKRLQEGGWARQITVRDFPISTQITGVNMRLIAGGIRELHWHQANEWAIMLYGNARITLFDQDGRSVVDDVKEGDLWFFPSGFPHSIQGLGPDGCEFLLVFDDGNFSEDETLLLSDWLAHTPPNALSKNLGIPLSDLKNIPQKNLYIFPGREPKSLQADIEAVASPGHVTNPFTYSLYSQKPNKVTKGGEARIVDSSTFKASNTIAGAYLIIHPGGMREMHWHPNADEWLYFISGKGRVTVFAGVGKARTMDFDAGDVGYIPKSMGHFIENTGDCDLRFLEMFKSSYFAEVPLSDWLSHTPPELVEQHLNISKEAYDKIPKTRVVILPE